MRILICAAAATVLAIAGAQDAFADAEPGQGYFSIMGSYIDDDSGRDLEDSVNGGQMGVGYAFDDRWNIEAFVSMAQADASLAGVEDEEHLGVGVDLQHVFRRSESFSPYVFFGLGYFKTTIRGVDRDGEMYSFGAGFLVDLFDTNVALRGEFRRRAENATSPESYFDDNLFSLGLQIPFGAPSQPMAYAEVEGDADGDGVGDNSDRCPDTPAGARVDANGCELDSDGDGVKDSQDECPGTPRGVPVDAKGCPLDSDGDGVTDDKDECPGTPAGVQVDVRGCEIKEEIRLEGVNFETNSDRLLPGAERILNEAVATLKKNPTIKFEVAGHTDSDGSAAYNEGLSARRAQTVHDYLANSGIDVSRMSVRGYGESEPIADNSTAAGKAQNRRVVLRITER